MLISSWRYRPGDLATWARLERLDKANGRYARLARLEEKALADLAAFASAGPLQVTVSWGKDSVVVAHLAVRVGVGPLVWYPAGDAENPECHLVRDAFLARYPVGYREVEASLDSDDWDRLEGHDGAQAAFEQASRFVCRRYVSGVRAEESRTRSLAMGRHGTASRNTCRPIGWWRSEDVFAYLARHDLPVHPAYAMSMGGLFPRERIRVATIGGHAGESTCRREWERVYYRDRLDALGMP